jgi:hypothetical protein
VKRFVLAAASLVVLGAASCDPFPADQAIGVTITSSGQVQVAYVSCGTESVRDVEVVIPNGIAGDSNDVVLWRIHRESGPAGGGPFTVGTTPAGFDTTVPWSSPLPVDATLAAVITSDRASGVGDFFVTKDLKRGTYRVNEGSYLPYSELSSRAATSCGTPTGAARPA